MPRILSDGKHDIAITSVFIRVWANCESCGRRPKVFLRGAGDLDSFRICAAPKVHENRSAPRNRLSVPRRVAGIGCGHVMEPLVAQPQHRNAEPRLPEADSVGDKTIGIQREQVAVLRFRIAMSELCRLEDRVCSHCLKDVRRVAVKGYLRAMDVQPHTLAREQMELMLRCYEQATADRGQGVTALDSPTLHAGKERPSTKSVSDRGHVPGADHGCWHPVQGDRAPQEDEPPGEHGHPVKGCAEISCIPELGVSESEDRAAQRLDNLQKRGSWMSRLVSC